MFTTAGPNVSRACPACGSNDRVHRGEKSAFELVSCTSCGTIYTSTLPNTSALDDYVDYYSDANLSVPEFIQRRVEEIVAGFDSYRQTNRLLEIGFGAGT